ncbi:UNVERIFIED_CONTAM: hypothetical protein FKN15_050766 [Acipenser sinensis]
MENKEKENESLKLRLEISESELKAVRGCINAADADIKQPLIFQDSIESHAIPESEAQEGPKIEAVYTQEESFEQECCASLMQVTELACVKDEEVPQQECVPIKEEFIEQECVPIAEELPHENHVCTLEENNKLGSNLCDDSPSECELGFRDAAKCTKITDMFRRPAGSRESEGRQDASVNQPTQPREPTEEDDAVAGSSTAANRYHPCADSGMAKMNTLCPPKRVLSAARFFTHCELTVQPPQSYSVGGQCSSGQLTDKPAGARPDYRGRWCAVS